VRRSIGVKIKLLRTKKGGTAWWKKKKKKMHNSENRIYSAEENGRVKVAYSGRAKTQDRKRSEESESNEWR